MRKELSNFIFLPLYEQTHFLLVRKTYQNHLHIYITGRQKKISNFAECKKKKKKSGDISRGLSVSALCNGYNKLTQ